MRRYGNLGFGGLLAFVVVWGGAWRQGLAAPIPFNSLVVYRVGDGSAPLTDAAAPVFIDSYGFDGAYLQTIPVPSSGPNALTAVGNDPTEGLVSRSRDQRAFYFTGYRKDAGSANPSADSSATTNRVLGNVRLSGVADTSLAVVDAPTGTIRSAASDNGSAYWFATEGGVRYVGAPSGAASSAEINTIDSRQVLTTGGGSELLALFASNSSSATAEKVQVFSPAPTGAATSAPVVTLTSADVAHGMLILDWSAGVAGPDLLYVLSTNEGLLRKYIFDGTTWEPSGSLATDATSVTGFLLGAQSRLFLSSPTEISTFIDTGLFTIEGTPSTLVAAGTNTAFRGLFFSFGAGVPEPSGLALLSTCAFFAANRQRHRGTRKMAI